MISAQQHSNKHATSRSPIVQQARPQDLLLQFRVDVREATADDDGRRMTAPLLLIALCL
jgi:hypothetical protein